jgi:hypothetical protein
VIGLLAGAKGSPVPVFDTPHLHAKAEEENALHDPDVP